MEYTVHTLNGQDIPEIQDEDFRINSLQDALDLLGSAMFRQMFKIIIRRDHLCQQHEGGKRKARKMIAVKKPYLRFSIAYSD